MSIRLIIVATHPIQYQIPWFQALTSKKDIDLTVWFAVIPGAEQQGVGFGNAFEWDIPLLEGYQWEVLANQTIPPDLYRFNGLDTPDVYKKLKSTRPDVVIITGWHSRPMLQMLWACIRLGIPRIVRGESNNLRSRSTTVRLLHRLLLSRFDAYLAIGKASRAFYEQYGIAPERIFPAYYFIDNARFETQADNVREYRNTFRTTWHIPENATCYLFVGKLEPKKHLLDLLHALHRARHVEPMHLLVVGTGEQMDVAKALVDERNLPVTFAAFLNQTEITNAYVAADCLVLPSDTGETWGLVVNEAMICGLPAIVSDQVGCHPDLIQEGVTGTVFPCRDIDALADRLVRFASSDTGLAQMGANAQERVRAYSAENAAAGTLEAIEAVLGK